MDGWWREIKLPAFQCLLDSIRCCVLFVSFFFLFNSTQHGPITQPCKYACIDHYSSQVFFFSWRPFPSKKKYIKNRQRRSSVKVTVKNEPLGMNWQEKYNFLMENHHGMVLEGCCQVPLGESFPVGFFSFPSKPCGANYFFSKPYGANFAYRYMHKRIVNFKWTNDTMQSAYTIASAMQGFNLLWRSMWDPPLHLQVN
jgi:hypothetical protein